MNSWKRWFRLVPDSVWWTFAGLCVGFPIFWVGTQPYGVMACRIPQGVATTYISYHWSWVGMGRCVVMREEPNSPEARIFRESSRLDCQSFQRKLEAEGQRCRPEGTVP